MTHRWIFSALLLAAWSSHALAAQPDASPPSVLVTLTPLRQGSLAHTLLAYGTVQAPPSARQMVMAPAAETVGTVYVHEGDEVAKGAPLLQLVPNPQTAAAYAQARSALRVAEQLAARTRQMQAQHLATAQQLADAQKSALDARAELAALKARGAGGPETLRAPFRAIVLRLSTAPGTQASAGAPLLALAQPAGMVLKVGVAPAEAGLVERGDKASVSAEGGQPDIPASVLQRGSIIDPATGLVPVEIALPVDRLLPGQAAAATITVGQTQGYVVPHAALLIDDHGNPYVVQADDMKAHKVQVQVVGMQGDEDVIRGARLDAGQPLVLAGNYQLDDGMNLRLAAPGSHAEEK